MLTGRGRDGRRRRHGVVSIAIDGRRACASRIRRNSSVIGDPSTSTHSTPQSTIAIDDAALGARGRTGGNAVCAAVCGQYSLLAAATHRHTDRLADWARVRAV